MSSEDALKGSAARLWKLIDERTRAGSDTDAIDQRIWDLFGQEWAVVFTDLVGFSRQVARFGIIHFLQVILEQKRLLLPLIERHDGILIKLEADSFLVLFRHAHAAVACAVAMQRACQALNMRRVPEEQVILCVGIGHGRVLKIGDEDVYGEEVNAASKLGEDTAKGNDILVTAAARAAAGEVAGVTWQEMHGGIPGAELFYRAVYQ
jgi:class 3 adenylate cyclase